MERRREGERERECKRREGVGVGGEREREREREKNITKLTTTCVVYNSMYIMYIVHVHCGCVYMQVHRVRQVQILWL